MDGDGPSGPRVAEVDVAVLDAYERAVALGEAVSNGAVANAGAFPKDAEPPPPVITALDVAWNLAHDYSEAEAGGAS